MRAFSFRLEQARRWRNAQLIVQEAKVSAAGATIARLQGQLDAAIEALQASAALIREAPTGETLNAHAEFTRHAHRRIPELQKRVLEARRTLNAEMSLLIQARRRSQLIEDLKDSEKAAWQKDFDKETAEFVDESHLGQLQAERTRLRRLQSQVTIVKKRVGA
jgi:flagellar export protein FliJ